MKPSEAADLLVEKLKSAPPPADTERSMDEMDEGDATVVDMFDLGKTRERPKA